MFPQKSDQVKPNTISDQTSLEKEFQTGVENLIKDLETPIVEVRTNTKDNKLSRRRDNSTSQTKPTSKIKLDKQGRFRFGGYLFLIGKPTHPAQAKGLYLISNGSVEMLSGLFIDSKRGSQLAYSGDIKADGKRYFFKLLVDGGSTIEIKSKNNLIEGMKGYLRGLKRP